jgi:ABC-type antimicrobial peptide transport system permease subunit
MVIFNLTEQAGYSNQFTLRSKNLDKKISKETVEKLNQGDFNLILPLAKEISTFSTPTTKLQTELVGANLTTLIALFKDSNIIEGKLPESHQTPLECIQGVEIRGYSMQNLTYTIQKGNLSGDCKVVGTVTGIAELQQSIIVNLDDFATITGDPLVNVSYSEIKIQTRRILSITEMKDKLAEILTDQYPEIIVWNEQQADIFLETLMSDILRNLELLYFVLLIIAFIRLFHFISWFTISQERIFLIMRALGMSRTRLFLLIVILGQIIGNIGLLLGVFVGYALPPIIIAILSTVFGIGFLVTEFPLPNIGSLWLISVIIIATATIIPSLRISNTPPAKISMLIREL